MDYDLCYCNGEEISLINYTIFLCSVVPFTIFSAFILSSIFVEKYVWRPYVKESLMECVDMINEGEKEEEKEIYTDKYKLEMDEEEETRDEIFYKTICVIENTPKGNVIMKYNKTDEIWEYYADKKYKNNITFDELDTVCRKFCKTYDSCKLYVDRKLDIEQQKLKEKEKKEDENRPIETTEEEPNLDDELFIKAKVPTNKSNKSNKISAQNSNKYKYKGEIKDFWAFNIKNETKKEIDEEVGWSAWKKNNYFGSN